MKVWVITNENESYGYEDFQDALDALSVEMEAMEALPRRGETSVCISLAEMSEAEFEDIRAVD